MKHYTCNLIPTPLTIETDQQFVPFFFFAPTDHRPAPMNLAAQVSQTVSRGLSAVTAQGDPAVKARGLSGAEECQSTRCRGMGGETLVARQNGGDERHNRKQIA